MLIAAGNLAKANLPFPTSLRSQRLCESPSPRLRSPSRPGKTRRGYFAEARKGVSRKGAKSAEGILEDGVMQSFSSAGTLLAAASSVRVSYAMIPSMTLPPNWLSCLNRPAW